MAYSTFADFPRFIDDARKKVIRNEPEFSAKFTTSQYLFNELARVADSVYYYSSRQKMV